MYSLVIADHFNQYTHTTGVIPDDDNALLNPRVFKIEDNTLVIQLLSVPLQTDQKSNDQLYKVIMELVSAVFTDHCVRRQKYIHIARWLLEKPI